MLARAVLIAALYATGVPAAMVQAGDYPSVQAAVNANPGRLVWLADGTWSLRERVRLDEDSASGLVGPGRLEQTNPAEPVVEVEHCRGALLRDLTLTRPAGSSATAPAVLVDDAPDLRLEDLQITGNAAPRGAIEIRRADGVTVRGCRITDYTALAVDDRTGPPDSANARLYGYAFRCLDGSGIVVRESRGIALLDNQIRETRWRPTAAVQREQRLGELVDGRYPPTAGLLGGEVRRTGAVQNWHQGSAILVTSPTTTRGVLLRGNRIEQAAQGIDLHADQVTCTANQIDNALIGIKLTHGCRGALVAQNLLSRIDLWGILLNPGSASTPDNRDEGVVIADNLILDPGYGDAWWNWGARREQAAGTWAIYLDGPQVPTAPALRAVLIRGNVVRAGAVPRYHCALGLAPQGRDAAGAAVYPEGLTVVDNLFEPGVAGVCNVPGVMPR
ncbi:MAG: right-handed parallel beta-helix repeat-containing protein [Fimbriimonadaceae bacterium]|nr:right-handed parallel beta-helix repeat-containing protein [Fimbriimonadaceae bacterium]